jgi:hypothetical protein
MQICFVDNNDSEYASSDMRAGMIESGKINFRTCFSKTLIPATFIIGIASHFSSSGSTDFQNAIDHWLLCEVLNAIGNHTVA